MKISLFSLLDRYPEQGLTVGGLFRDAIARGVRAEALGFDGLWFAEHHLRDFGSLPNPAVLLAAVAQRTRRIGIGPAVAVLPLRHPLQVAEDYLIVDQLSEGRLHLGVGSGTLAWEFAGFGIDIEDKADRFQEALDVLRPLLRGERVKHGGRRVRLDGQSNVPPVLAGGPPLYVATNRVENARLAGRSGDGLLTLVSPETAGLEVIDERLASYRLGVAEAGRAGAGNVAVAIMAHVAPSDAEAIAGARPAMLRFLETHAEIDTRRACSVFDAMRERGTGLFGSVDSVTAGLRSLGDRGVRHVVLWMDFGGIDRRLLDASLDRLAGEVRPRLSGGRNGGRARCH